MFTANPASVVAVDQATDTAIVTLDGVEETVSVALLESVAVGDHVLVHVGCALNRICAKEARSTLASIAKDGLDTTAEELAAA